MTSAAPPPPQPQPCPPGASATARQPPIQQQPPRKQQPPRQQQPLPAQAPPRFVPPPLLSAHFAPSPLASQLAVSSPTKRDLKSWWKGFKLPSKAQEPHDWEDKCVVQLSVAHLRDTLGGQEAAPAAAAQEASASLSQQPMAESRPQSKPQSGTGTIRRVLTLRSGSGGSKKPREQQAFAEQLRLTESDVTRPQGIFGVPLRQSIVYANVAISLVDEKGQSYIYGYVPIVVAKCGVFLKEKATEVEGIFRLAGSEKRIKELKTLFDSPDRYGKGLVWDGFTVHDAANVLRRYLNDLPEPVVPLDLYEKFREPLRGATRQPAGDADGPYFVEGFNMDAAIRRYQHLITELPSLNRQLMLYLLDLLAVFAAKSDVNRMNSSNLAAIFQPGILTHPTDVMKPNEYRLNQCVLIFLIENQDHFLIGMLGTATDEKTVRELQKGSRSNKPLTPIRRASNASAGAASVAKDGQIRRNKSNASRRSHQSSVGPGPDSPAFLSTPKGSGLSRSNTVPSKKSPALSADRFLRNDSGGVPPSPLTPVHARTPTSGASPPPAVAEDRLTVPDHGVSSTSTGVPLLLRKSRERLLDPHDNSPPSKRLPNIFQRTPSGESSDARQPNKLKKKRLPGAMNQSAQSSSASLPPSAATTASPTLESSPALETIPSPNPTEQVVMGSTDKTPSADTPSELTPRASQVPPATPAVPLAPAAALAVQGENWLRPRQKSPPTSLHSSFNEGSDLDVVDDLPPNILASNPSNHAAEPVSADKAKKRFFRLSRPEQPNASGLGPVRSPKKMDSSINDGNHSNSSKGSLGGLSRSQHTESWDMNSSTVAISAADGPATLSSSEATAAEFQAATQSGGRTSPSTTEMGSGNDSGGGGGGKEREAAGSVSGSNRDDASKTGTLKGWIKTKYRERREHAEHRRNKSPGGHDKGAVAAIPPMPTSATAAGARAKSRDSKLSGEDDVDTAKRGTAPNPADAAATAPRAQP